MIVQRNTIKDQVYDLIRNRILSREYPPGYKININALAEECGISNTPIREALSMMQKDKLVTFSTNQGYQVFHINNKDNSTLNTMLPLLLLGSYDLLIERGEVDKLVAVLEKALDCQTEKIRSGNQIEMADAAVEWESAFFKATEDENVIEYLEFYMTKVALTLYYDFIYNGRDPTFSLEEHTAITKAIKNSEPELARRLIVEHHKRPILLETGGHD
ncbi:MAG: GntR family transcriptional regulator [Clostridiales Family XIII bacterium]|nr:GntR family transcriptional regulator [Clostridiales Family XIII bacterium]